MNDNRILICICIYLLETSCALQCYDCGKGHCTKSNEEVNKDTPTKACNEGEWCGSSSAYSNGTLQFVMRQCMDKNGGDCKNECTKPSSKGWIDCLGCCDQNLCNGKIPSNTVSSGSSTLSPVFVILFLFSALLSLVI